MIRLKISNLRHLAENYLNFILVDNHRSAFGFLVFVLNQSKFRFVDFHPSRFCFSPFWSRYSTSANLRPLTFTPSRFFASKASLRATNVYLFIIYEFILR